MTAQTNHVIELQHASAALLKALRERDPGFLEHLERRQRALAALKTNPAQAADLPALEAALADGDAAALEARAMRQEAVKALQRLQSRRSLSRGLSATTPAPNSGLDFSA